MLVINQKFKQIKKNNQLYKDSFSIYNIENENIVGLVSKSKFWKLLYTIYCLRTENRFNHYIINPLHQQLLEVKNNKFLEYDYKMVISELLPKQKFLLKFWRHNNTLNIDLNHTVQLYCENNVRLFCKYKNILHCKYYVKMKRKRLSRKKRGLLIKKIKNLSNYSNLYSMSF